MNDNEDSDTDRDEQIFKLTDALLVNTDSGKLLYFAFFTVILCIFTIFILCDGKSNLGQEGI